MKSSNDRPRLSVRVFGRAVATLVSVAPALWPTVRGPVRAFFDSAADSWDRRTGAGSFEHLEPLAVAVSALGAHPERVLDLGCGTGETTLFLSREFPTASVRGADLSSEMVREATRRVGLDPAARISFRVADAAALPWSNDSFDLVSQVDLPLFTGEVARVLRPGGNFLAVSSKGPHTPFHTPDVLYRTALRRAGMTAVEDGVAGYGSWRLARLPDDV